MIKGMFTPQTPQPLQDHILKMMLDAPEATAVGAMGAMFDPTMNRTAVINAPALAVYAGTNTIPDLATMRQVVPKFEATQIAGTGHFVMMEKPAEFNAILTAFLREDQVLGDGLQVTARGAENLDKSLSLDGRVRSWS